MPDCNTCEKKKPNVPWEVHQDAMARANLANRRWFITWLITFVLLIGVVVFLFWQRSQYEAVENEYTQKIETGNGDLDIDGSIINRGGVFYYGKDYADSQNKILSTEDWR